MDVMQVILYSCVLIKHFAGSKVCLCRDQSKLIKGQCECGECAGQHLELLDCVFEEFEGGRTASFTVHI